MTGNRVRNHERRNWTYAFAPLLSIATVGAGCILFFQNLSGPVSAADLTSSSQNKTPSAPFRGGIRALYWGQNTFGGSKGPNFTPPSSRAGEATYQAQLQELLQLPFVTGVNLYIPWMDYEPSRAQFEDWYIQDAINIAEPLGKTVSFGLLTAYYSPQWLKLELAAENPPATFSVIHPIMGPLKNIPNPWSPFYVRSLEAAVTHLGKIYDGNQNLLYVTIDGPAPVFGVEETWFITPNSVSWQDLNEIQFTVQKYIGGWEAMIDRFAQAFPHTALSLALNDDITMNDPASCNPAVSWPEAPYTSATTGCQPYPKNLVQAVSAKIREYALAKQSSRSPAIILRLLGLSDGFSSNGQQVSQYFNGPCAPNGSPNPYMSLTWHVRGQTNIVYEMAQVWSNVPYSSKQLLDALNIGASCAASAIEVKAPDLLNANYTATLSNFSFPSN